MIVDDSLTVRTIFSRVVEVESDLKVVAVANTAEAALEALKSVRVDVILLDLEMPGMSGLEALPLLMQAAPGVRVLMISSLTVDGGEKTLEALALGAADTLAKPVSGRFDITYRASLIERIRALGSGKAAQCVGGMATRAGRPVPQVRPATGKSASVLAIGASTGGIHALGALFHALPRNLGIPMLVTQHLPASFMPIFARQLQTASGCDAKVAEEGMELHPNRILIAPGDAHLTVRNTAGRLIVQLDNTPAPSGCMPSVDPMFASLAEEVGAHALGVVLSGMGRDGVEGGARLVAAGGTIFAQDEASCAVWGMPRAIAEAGLASAILTPEEIACRITANVGVPAWK